MRTPEEIMGASEVSGGGAPAILAQVAARAAGQAGAENFPVALRLLPAGPKERLRRIYAYARFVDDVGDEAPGGPGDRLELLDLIADDVRELHTGSPRLPVIAALGELVDECQVPVQAFLDLIEANRLDQSVTAYQTFDDLLDYCRLSAAPIGRMVLHVAGAATGPNLAHSDSVCAALQVLEHCQDVGEDAQAGRVYLPAAELAAAGVDAAALHADVTGPKLREVVAVQAARAVAMLWPGRALVRRLTGWARIAIAGYVAGGYATADALARADYDVLARHVPPAKPAIARHAARLVVGR